MVKTPKKLELCYQGKAKSLYRSSDPDKLIMVFRDDVSAFDGTKTDILPGKGVLNNQFNAYIMAKLAEAGVVTQMEAVYAPDAAVVKHLDMLPIECVVRNYAAGSLCRRLGVERGQPLAPPLFEFFLKNDALHDPLITSDHIEHFGWATAEQVRRMRQLSLAINTVLSSLFAQVGLILVDYKLEFGVVNGTLVLGDEFTPDGCRLWDAKTKQNFDKDIYRQDTGDLLAAYRAVSQRIGVPALEC